MTLPRWLRWIPTRRLPWRSRRNSLRKKRLSRRRRARSAEQTFKVTNTAYLSNISRKFYGHYAFWVYIYLDNKDIITDPDNLPVGAELRIPAPEKYGIDKNNPESIKRAEIKALEIKNGK